MMRYFKSELFLILCTLLISVALEGSDASYNYKASIHCLAEPKEPQYGGGMFKDPMFNSQLLEWKVYGNASMEKRKSTTNNNFLVAFNRTNALDGVSYSFDIQKNHLYTFSAWIQVDEGQETILAYIATPSETKPSGSVIAKSGCWSMLKGGFTAYEDEKVDLIFKVPNTKNEVWIDNVSLKSFTKAEWREQQERSINKYRKRDIKIKVTDEAGKPLEGANITLTHTRPLFLIGCGTGYSILEAKPYQDFFAARFPAATPHNEMKWYYNENVQGVENYETADAMMSFFEKNNIAVRGHCILWDATNATKYWTETLPPREFLYTTIRRVASVVSRYTGRVIAWDVVNENLHNSYYESILGANASAMIYQVTRAIDPHTPLFINEYNTLEYPKDLKVIPARIVHKIREIKSFPGNEDMVLHIGMQGHFNSLRANISYIRAAFDVMGASGSPIWLTELDFLKCDTQHEDLENVLRESFSHPAVEGIIIFGGWKKRVCRDECLNAKDYLHMPMGCGQMCLIDNNFKITPTGELVDRLILKEWRSNIVAVTDKDGVFSSRLFHGDYNLTCSHPSMPNPVEITFKLEKEEAALQFGITLK